MGIRCLRTSIARPSTQVEILNQRLDAIDELASDFSLLRDLEMSVKCLPDLHQKLTSVILYSPISMLI